MDGETVYLAAAYYSDASRKFVHHIQEVRRFAGPGGVTLYEREDGSRERDFGYLRVLPTMAAAEVWCAAELERLVAPTVETAAKLREQAAARVASQEVVSV